MGMRFRKSINLGGGARLNFSKSGIGTSVGGKGFRVTKKAGGGTRTTISAPGTGISYVSESGKGANKSAATAAAASPNFLFFWIMFRLLSILLIGFGALLALIEPSSGLLSIAGGAACWMAATYYKKKHRIYKVNN